MIKTEDQLEKALVSIEDKIISAGQYIDATCEGIPGEGIVAYDDGVVITDPVGKADEIIRVAKDVKKLATQYQALLILEDKIVRQNKKATNDSTVAKLGIVND